MTPKGYIVLTGKGVESDFIYQKMFDLLGNKEKINIAIISNESFLNSNDERLNKHFVKNHGIINDNIWTVPFNFDNNQNAKDNKHLSEGGEIDFNIIGEKLKEFQVVFFADGDYFPLLDVILQSDTNFLFAKAIRKIYHEGGLIVGNGSGCSMLLEQAQYLYPDNSDNVKIQGINLINNFTIDTIADVKGRFSRLAHFAVMDEHNYGLSIGQDTAVFITDTELEIIGNKDVLLIDRGSSVLYSDKTEGLHIKNLKVHLFTHGDKYDYINKTFVPNPLKGRIKNTPFFDTNEYHISLDVFKEYESSFILINYMLDNEAKDVIALTNDDYLYNEGKKSTFIRYVETNETDVYFGKYSVDGASEIKSYYSGINVMMDIAPFVYADKNKKAKGYKALIFAVDNDLQIVAYDTIGAAPVCDAKVRIFENTKLIYKKGTDRFGRSLIKNVLELNKEYTVELTYDFETISNTFVFNNNMDGICIQ